MNTATIAVTKESALEAVQCLADDVSLLASGDWQGDDEGCEASLGMVERLTTFINTQQFPESEELDGAKKAVACLGEDFPLLAAGDWTPDDDSCEASLTMIERLRTFITATASV